MTEKLIPATRVVIEVKPDRQIEGPPTDEIVMSSWLRNGKWSGDITMLKSRLTRRHGCSDIVLMELTGERKFRRDRLRLGFDHNPRSVKVRLE